MQIEPLTRPGPGPSTKKPEPPLAVPDPITFLTGRWTFARTIDDRLAAESGGAEGVAVFEPCGQGLRWREEGRLVIGGRSFDAAREMSIRPEAGGWLVRFDDGRRFHRLDLNRGTCTADHPCGDDLYTGEYRVTEGAGGPEFTTVWTVTGPNKDQLIFTRYRRPAGRT